MDETCGVCWASHECGLPPRHYGDHGCIDEDDDAVPHETWPRDAEHQYGIDLLRYDGDFCDICGPIEKPSHAFGALDHAMREHQAMWAEHYADDFRAYLGDGRWSDDPSLSPRPGNVVFQSAGPIRRVVE